MGLGTHQTYSVLIFSIKMFYATLDRLHQDFLTALLLNEPFHRSTVLTL